mgnify:CR=1 FL=1
MAGMNSPMHQQMHPNMHPQMHAPRHEAMAPMGEHHRLPTADTDGVAAEAAKLDLPFLGEIPLALEVRIAGDSGTPIAAGDGTVAEAYARLAHRLVAGGMA